MARVTKAELEQQVKELDEKCNEYIKQLINKDNEIARLKELADDSYEKSSTYIQQCKKIELLEEQIEAYKLSVEHKKKKKKTLVDNYEEEIKRLNEEVQKLKNENKVRIHNERGAGRKERFTEQEKESIRMYRLQGKTIKEIAEMFNCSIGLIHKLINK